MRAGPLSHTSVVELLNEDFINTWVLAKHLESIAETTTSAPVRKAALLLAKKNLVPVDSFALSPDGDFLSAMWAEDMYPFSPIDRSRVPRDRPRRNLPEKMYADFLKSALKAYPPR